jgi:drug/metabolite transporter (DMT)-like permease
MRTVNHAARVPPPVRDCPAAGILFLCTGAFVFSLQDVVIKWISGAYPVSQVLAVRSVVAFAPILLLLHLEGGLAGLRSRRLGLLLFRGALLFLSYTAYYLAVAAIPLAEAVSLFYSAPLFIAALSVQLLREEVAPRQWVAVLFGFLGVLVICRPGFGLLDPTAFLALLSAAVYAGGAVASRDLGRTEPASVMTFYHNAVNLSAALLIGLVVGDGAHATGGHASAQFLLRAWVLPSGRDLVVIASTGLVAALGSWCLSNAYRVAPANVVAPFEYSAITWAVLWGFLFWGEVPSAAVVLGMAMIVGAGVWVVRAVGGGATLPGVAPESGSCPNPDGVGSWPRA